MKKSKKQLLVNFTTSTEKDLRINTFHVKDYSNTLQNNTKTPKNKKLKKLKKFIFHFNLFFIYAV